VEVEPKLQPLSGEQFDLKSANKDDDARSDIKCTGFWRPLRQAFFDVKIVSPMARSYAQKSPASLYNMAEKAKIREYRQRILEVEHGDFNPLVFSTQAVWPLRVGWLSSALRKKLHSKKSFICPLFLVGCVVG
jgi:hypothetical protein